MQRSAIVMRCTRLPSVTRVYCGQTVGRIKMKLGMQIGLCPGHIVLDGDPAPLPQTGTALPKFLAHICCGQMAAWIKMSLGMEQGLGPGDFVLDGDPACGKQGCTFLEHNFVKQLTGISCCYKIIECLVYRINFYPPS